MPEQLPPQVPERDVDGCLACQVPKDGRVHRLQGRLRLQDGLLEHHLRSCRMVASTPAL
jgi:hypothetical protein